MKVFELTNEMIIGQKYALEICYFNDDDLDSEIINGISVDEFIQEVYQGTRTFHYVIGENSFPDMIMSKSEIRYIRTSGDEIVISING